MDRLIVRSLARLARLALALAAGLALAGCASGDPSAASRSTGPAPSVQASDVTHIPAQSQSQVMNFPTGEQQSSVLRVEQVSPREVRAGSEYTYQVRVTNLTDRPLQHVVLRASKPEGLRLAEGGERSATARPDAEGWLSYNVGNLGPRETRAFPVTGTPTGTGMVRQTYDVKYEQQMATAVNVTAPAVAITKEGPREVDVCQEIDWHYTVSNPGSGIARNVMLRDALPEGLTTIDGKGMVAADLGDIPASQSRQAVARLKAAHAGQFASAATVTSDAGEAKSPSVTTVARQPKLELTVKGPEQEYVGKPVTYQVTITNTGDTAAQRAVVRFDASENARLVGVNDGAGAQLAAAESGPGRSVGTLDAGQSKTLSVTFQATQGGVLKVDAAAEARCATRVARAAQTNILTVAALLLEAVDVVDPVRVGENVVYRIKVTNQGNGPDTNIRVTATLPGGEEYVKAAGVTGATSEGQIITFAPVPSLSPKQSATWEVTAKAVKAGDVQFKVTAASDAVKVPAEKTEPTKLY